LELINNNYTFVSAKELSGIWKRYEWRNAYKTLDGKSGPKKTWKL
jgi:hypothetical protein